jgi:hypothetical protein
MRCRRCTRSLRPPNVQWCPGLGPPSSVSPGPWAVGVWAWAIPVDRCADESPVAHWTKSRLQQVYCPLSGESFVHRRAGEPNGGRLDAGCLYTLRRGAAPSGTGLMAASRDRERAAPVGEDHAVADVPGALIRLLRDAGPCLSPGTVPERSGDIRGSGPSPLIIDEVQRGGDELIRAVKILMDQRQDRGQFILSGSARFLTVRPCRNRWLAAPGSSTCGRSASVSGLGLRPISRPGCSAIRPACLPTASPPGPDMTTLT